MNSLPVTWTGDWIDDTGRSLRIELAGDGAYKVSVKDRDGVPYEINSAGLTLPNEETTNLKAALVTDNHGQLHLQVEAGIDEVGPTYRLFFVIKEKNGQVRLAEENDPVEEIRIVPDIGMGLYDEWEDDLGVPWALPLREYKKV